MMREYLLPAATGFLVSAVLLCLLVPVLKRKKAGQEILQYVTEHSGKQGTPTMGGLAFIAAIIAVTLLFCGVTVKTVNVTLAVFAAYAVVGFLDDFLKIRYKHNMGLRPYQKIIVQLAIAVVVALFVQRDATIGDRLYLPFSGKTVEIGFWIVPFVVFIYLACTNGVNLTDGLDGLATCSTLCYLVGMFVLIALRSERTTDAATAVQYRGLLVLIAASFGALLAFLAFNCFPAKVFMGDVGSLSLGALVACVSIFTNMSLVIPVLGLVFVVSCASVILQVGYFKVTHGKRIFLMAPFHHHLQKKGLSETRIAVLYSLVTLLCGGLLVYFGGY